MEGANLYDVFQKISKGEYQPLPADRFSSRLRQLVVRMLSVDPAARPDLEEVWEVTQSVVAAQAKSRQDVHSASEHIYCQLMMLEAQCSDSLAGGDGGTGPRTPPLAARRTPNGKRTGGAAAPHAPGDALPEAPTDTLRVIHPAFFAEPLTAMPRGLGGGGRDVYEQHFGAGTTSDEAQKSQLGAFLSIFAWLLRVGGRPDLAPPVEGMVEMRAIPGTRRAGGGGAGAPTHPPSGRQGIHKSGSGGSRGARDGGRSAAAAAAVGNGDANGLSPTPPPPPACFPVCTNLLKGAEAAKKAAQGVGLSTEFAPVTAVATGHGRAVCSLMQDMIDATVARVPIVAKRPPKRRQAEGEEEEEVQEDPGLVVDGDDNAVLTAASPLPSSYLHQGGMEEEEGIEALWGPPGRGSPLNHNHSHSSQRGRPGGGEANAAHAPAGSHQVDPVAWRRELERLAPQLSRIKVKAHAVGGVGPAADWGLHWESTKKSLRAVQESTPEVMAALRSVSAVVGQDLESISSTERRLNGDHDIASKLEQLAAARTRWMRGRAGAAASAPYMWEVLCV